MEKIKGYEYNPKKFKKCFLVKFDGMGYNLKYKDGSKETIISGDEILLSPDISEGDVVIRFKDNPIGGEWFTGMCGKKQKDGFHIIFRDGISCGETRTQIWYKILAVI